MYGYIGEEGNVWEERVHMQDSEAESRVIAKRGTSSILFSSLFGHTSLSSLIMLFFYHSIFTTHFFISFPIYSSIKCKPFLISTVVASCRSKSIRQFSYSYIYILTNEWANIRTQIWKRSNAFWPVRRSRINKVK